MLVDPMSRKTLVKTGNKLICYRDYKTPLFFIGSDCKAPNLESDAHKASHMNRGNNA